MSLTWMSQRKVTFFINWIRRDKLILVQTMLYKMTHISPLYYLKNMKCSVDRSRFTSGVDYIEKKTKNDTTWVLLYLLVTKSHNSLFNANPTFMKPFHLFDCLGFYGYNNNLPRYRKHNHHLPQLVEWKWWPWRCVPQFLKHFNTDMQKFNELW